MLERYLSNGPKSIIKPIPKSTQLSKNPQDYRGISLDSTVLKPFCSILESKMTPAQSDEEVTRQLQANMILLSSCLLRRKIEENPGDADSINLLTCYGLQLGSTYPVKIIKQ